MWIADQRQNPTAASGAKPAFCRVRAPGQANCTSCTKRTCGSVAAKRNGTSLSSKQLRGSLAADWLPSPRQCSFHAMTLGTPQIVIAPPRSDATFPIQQASLLAGPQFPGRGWGVVESSPRPNPQGHSTKGDPVGPWSRTARHCVPGYPVHCWILIGSPPCQVRAMNKFPSRTLMIKLVYSIHSVHSCPPAYIMTGTMQFIDTCTTGIRKRRSL